MKILVVGGTERGAHELSCARFFRHAGCDVRHWDNKRPNVWSLGRSWWRLGHAGRAVYNTAASLAFLQTALDFRPDVIYLPKGENLHHAAIREALDRTRARLVVWFPDHPFHAHFTSMHILRNLRRCDLFFIWGRFLVDALRAAGCRRVEYLPFGFDAEAHPLDGAPPPIEHDLVFVGTWDPDREAALRPLAGRRLALWGPRWHEGLAPDSPLRPHLCGAGVYGADLVRAFRSARIVFNHLRDHNGPAHNVRTMEATGIGGGVLLVRRTPEQAAELFTEGEHLHCFADEQELHAQVHHILAAPDTARAMAEKAGRHVRAHHLLRCRLEHLLDCLR
jgi:spore maturation protein CgeB